VAVLRLDTDWYASTLVELEALYPRVSSGGVLLVDDYGHWLLHRTDYTGRSAVKGS
jgi:O-methyltransferase